MNPLPLSLSRDEAIARYGEGLTGVEALTGADLLANHAEEVAEVLSSGGLEIFWTEEDFPAIDAWLNEAPPEEEEEIQRIAWDLGILIGEIILREVGGKWQPRKEEVHNSLFFPRINHEFFPIHAVLERLISEDSKGVETFYNSVIQALLD